MFKEAPKFLWKMCRNLLIKPAYSNLLKILYSRYLCVSLIVGVDYRSQLLPGILLDVRLANCLES